MADADRLPLPRTTRELIGHTSIVERHPGLQLDKYLPLLDDQGRGFQEVQRDALVDAYKARGNQTLLAALLHRRERLLEALSAIAWSCRTTGPLTLHLARASALENAGLCLHPIYGFTYLPGSGLKGMARAFAETVWLPGQGDQRWAWRRIEDVFGWAPDPERRRRILNGDHPAGPRHENDEMPESPEMSASAGAVVFHDAWPERWPQLRLDVVNNHHGDYYLGKDDPGDWESPSPVTFLSVGVGETFSFALSKRLPEVGDDLVRAAREWLTGALTHLGAGAKTAAGYGGFAPAVGDAPAATPPASRTFETELVLVTPAFLAGANQGADDCELRPATLRGLLRWWWRTMHVGHVDRQTLRRLEAAVWGDTEAGSPVRVTVAPAATSAPRRFPSEVGEKGRPRVARAFLRQNEIQPPAPKTVQGLFYLAYGMFEGDRYFETAGATWAVRVIARRSWLHVPGATEDRRALAADLVLSQVTAALWLLCRFGGVGSKGRKGFGSFGDVSGAGVASLDDCRGIAADFRRECGLGDLSFDPRLAGSASLEQALDPIEIDTPWTNGWFALDQLGGAVQAFAKQYRREKRALGLPRRVRGTPATATGGKGARHASPVLYHLAKGASGMFTVRVLALPAKYLPPSGDHPDVEGNAAFLRKLLEFLKGDLNDRIRRHGGKGLRRPYDGEADVSGVAGSRSPSASPAARPRPGDLVRAVLLPEKTRKGGWKARHEATGLTGEIQNTGAVPADKHAGDTVSLKVAAVHPTSIAFTWPGPEQTAAARKPRR